MTNVRTFPNGGVLRVSDLVRAAQDDRDEIRRLISRSVRCLDDDRFADFVSLFTDDALYRMTATSREIGRDMDWLVADRGELSALLDELPRHVRDPAERLHMVTIDEIALDGARARAESSFAVYRTDIDGASQLYAVGRYEDELRFEGGGWKLSRRTVRLSTRQFVTPTPMPL